MGWCGGGVGAATSRATCALRPAGRGVRTPIAVAVFLITFLRWRIVALSSILSVTAFAIAQLVLLYPYPRATWSMLAFSLAAPALIVYRHRSNIVRIIHHEEATTQFGKRPPETSENRTPKRGEDSAA